MILGDYRPGHLALSSAVIVGTFDLKSTLPILGRRFVRHFQPTTAAPVKSSRDWTGIEIK
jgi:hypothetical protein